MLPSPRAVSSGDLSSATAASSPLPLRCNGAIATAGTEPSFVVFDGAALVTPASNPVTQRRGGCRCCCSSMVPPPWLLRGAAVSIERISPLFSSISSLLSSFNSICSI